MFSLNTKSRVPHLLIILTLVLSLLSPVLAYAQDATPESTEVSWIREKIDGLLEPVDEKFSIVVEHVNDLLFWKFFLEDGHASLSMDSRAGDTIPPFTANSIIEIRPQDMSAPWLSAFSDVSEDAGAGDPASDNAEPVESRLVFSLLPTETGEEATGTVELIQYVSGARSLNVVFHGIPDDARSASVVLDGTVLKTLSLIHGIPLIIVILVCGGVFFTIRYGFVNIHLFAHSIALLRGKYDNPDDEGEVSLFVALTSALAATVGLGNIAGVAVAISMGGPGAIFWMWCTAFFGMSLKFSSCTLAQVYRKIDDDGRVLGGPMVYLKEGIKECAPKFIWVGIILSPLYAILTMLAAIGGGNMFQSNQTSAVIAAILGMENNLALQFTIGVVLAILVGIVIIGGIKRIGEVTAKLVPTMCIGYVIVCLIILVANYAAIPDMFLSIIVQAFNPEAMYGGFLGVMIMGMRRAAFSNEAGLGSASIACAAAKTSEPIRGGLVAMLEPTIDTMLVCTMTALAILATGAHLGGGTGVVITLKAFASLWVGLPYFLGITVFVFAYSTMITWSYYGERATETLLGKSFIMPYRFLFIAGTALGPIVSLKNVLDFSDALMLSMAFPNIIGMLFLAKKVRQIKCDYISRLRSGEIKRVE